MVTARSMRRPIQFVVPIGVRDLLTVEKHEYFVCNLVVRKLHEAIAYTIRVLVRSISLNLDESVFTYQRAIPLVCL